PLTSILGFAQISYRRRGDSPDESLSGAVEPLMSEARRMAAILSNMLVLARLDAEAVTLKPVPLPPIVDQDELSIRDPHFSEQANTLQACALPRRVAPEVKVGQRGG